MNTTEQTATENGEIQCGDIVYVISGQRKGWAGEVVQVRDQVAEVAMPGEKGTSPIWIDWLVKKAS